MPATALHRSESYLSRPVAPFNAAGRTLFGPTRVPHDGLRIPPARSCPPLCLKVLCEPVGAAFHPPAGFSQKKVRGVNPQANRAVRRNELTRAATGHRSLLWGCAAFSQAPSSHARPKFSENGAPRGENEPGSTSKQGSYARPRTWI